MKNKNNNIVDKKGRSTALYYSAESYSVSGPKLMGRQAAGQSFLRAFVNAYADQQICALAHSADDSRLFAQELDTLGHSGGTRQVGLNQLEQLGASTLYLPSPGIEDIAWHRAKIGERSFSLCGVTHTTATHRVMETIANLPIAPVRPWDALICTSRSVRNTVQSIVEQQSEYLRWKLGATRFELPQFPVIPLGVHCDDYHFNSEQISAAKAKLKIPENDLVVLFVGRLSFHAKAHPHPMLQALQLCVDKGLNQKLHLVQCGWYANDAIEEAFNEIQQYLAPSVTHHFLDGRDANQRVTAWASADVFVSLSDNIQETFGLTPIEAMAAGIPCVVSDWDGYKDTVEHQVSGYRIPTLMAPAGSGANLAERYDMGTDTYDMYCGQLCQLVAVDVVEASDALYSLLSNKELRKKMGSAARKRACDVFGWDIVMGKYLELWDQLQHIRESQKSVFGGNPLSTSPARMDPMTLFDDYPSEVVTGTTCVSVIKTLSKDAYEKLIALGVYRYAKRILPTFDTVEKIFNAITALGESANIEQIIESSEFLNCDDQQRTTIMHTVVWLVKTGHLSMRV